MDNSNFKWRKTSRLIAYLDLGISTIELILIIVHAIFVNVIIAYYNKEDKDHEIQRITASNHTEFEHVIFVNATTTANEEKDVEIQRQTELKVFNIFMYLISIALFTMSWYSALLLKATKYGADSKYALNKAKRWCNASIFFVSIIIFICAVYRRYFVFLGILLLCRVCLMCVVLMFVWELWKSTKSAVLSAP